jgi:hypothetical protein
MGPSTYVEVVYDPESDATFGFLAPRKDPAAFRARCEEIMARRKAEANKSDQDQSKKPEH